MQIPAALSTAIALVGVAAAPVEMVAALQALGSPVRYTEYPDAGHDACTFPYGEAELPDWLFQQRRGA